jgi:menaquinone-9 beta-reductase
MTETTTIVVGGGLAGSAFAIELARRGRRVIVLEKTSGPHHKVCGEFLSAEAQALLGRLGLDVCQLGASPATSLGLEFATSLPVVALPFRGAGLSRYRLDQALLETAARAGAQVMRGVTVTRLEQSCDAMAVHTTASLLSATYVVLATGKHNLRGVSRPQAANVAFKMQLKLRRAATDALDHLVHLSIFRGGYAGVCLVEDGTATICWVIERGVLTDAALTWATHADFLAGRSAFFADLLTDAIALWDRPVAVASIPYGFLREAVVADAVYPVGDQLVVIPSYTGDGTSIALHTGMAAARAVLDGKTASQFQASALAKLKPQIAWAKFANVAFANTTAQRLAGVFARLAPWALPPAATFIATRTRLRL